MVKISKIQLTEPVFFINRHFLNARLSAQVVGFPTLLLYHEMPVNAVTSTFKIESCIKHTLITPAQNLFRKTRATKQLFTLAALKGLWNNAVSDKTIRQN